MIELFRRFVHARTFIALLLWTAIGTARADTVYLTQEDFLREVFGTPPVARTLWLDNAAQQEVSAILGHPYPRARLRYWRVEPKTAWVLEEIGKEYPITAGFVVQDHTLERARVLVYRETRGMEIHFPSFLQQFAGARLEGRALSKPIDGISGATLSVAAMSRMARTALLLDRVAR